MASKRHTLSQLSELGIKDGQAEVYLTLLAQDELRISQLVKICGIPRSSVYEHIQALGRMGLVEQLVRESHTLFRAAHIGSLRHTIDTKQESLKKQYKAVENLEKALDHWPKQINDRVDVKYFRGVNGARQLFWNSLKAENNVYVYSEWGRSRYLGIKFYRNFVEASRDRMIKEKVITNSKPSTLRSLRQDEDSPMGRTKTESVRFFSTEQLPVRGEALMYNDTYAHVYLKDDQIRGFEIRNQNFVDMQRAIFDHQWRLASKINQL